MAANIEIQNLQTKAPIRPAAIKTDILKILRQVGVVQGELSVVFLDDRKIRAINRKFLGHDYATDVLTFDWSEKRVKDAVRGEILLSVETAAKNARRYSTDLRAEVMLYIVHGVLHLLGFDDHSAADIRKMRAEEERVVNSIRSLKNSFPRQASSS